MIRLDMFTKPIARISVVLTLLGNCTAYAQTPIEAGLEKPGSSFLLHLDAQETPVLRGLVNLDAAGLGSSGMAYPMIGGPLGLVVGVLTHAAVVEGSKAQQKNALQTAADKVAEPYQLVVGKWSLNDLMRQALPNLAKRVRISMSDSQVSEQQGLQKLIISPTFALTQDEKAIVLDYTFHITKSTTSPESVTSRAIIRVVSHPLVDEEPRKVWLSDDGERLRRELSGLLAEATEISVSITESVANASDVKHKTVRYQRGAEDVIERAQLISKTCDRLLLKNLRGEFVSVPTKPAPQGCANDISMSPS